MSGLYLPSTVDDILSRVDELRDLNEPHVRMRRVTRAIMNGGADAVAALVADSEMEHLPAANLLHSGMERMAQKMSRPPQVRVDAPATTDSARARDRAEKRERIVDAYDRASHLEMQMPQAARWILGYGFVPWVVQVGETPDRQPFPDLQLRDPYGCLPGPWNIQQQPDDIAFVRRVPEYRLRRVYPNLPAIRRPAYSTSAAGLVNPTATGEWEVQSGQAQSTLNVVEYRNGHGTFIILEDARLLLDFIPVPEGVGAPFVVAKRFSFDRLMGHYEHVIGLQQMITRMNVLAFLSMMDSVFAETNVYGELTDDSYDRGRGAVNMFSPGTKVERPTDGNIQQHHQTQDRLERQLRLTGAYPVTDDAQSPNSFVTGRGLQELTQGADNVVNEYQTVFRHALELADTKRLCWDHKEFGHVERALPGYHKGAPYIEKYQPDRHIDGDYLTRRMYGLMSGLDSSQKLVGLLQISQAGWLDDISAMEQVDGIDNIQQVRERLDRQRADAILEQAMLALAQGQPPNEQLMRVLIDSLEPGPRRERYEKVFFPEPVPAGAGAPGAEGAVGPDGQLLQSAQPLAQAGETPQAIISRLFATGGAEATARSIQEQE